MNQLPIPPKRITDPGFQYVKADKTDIRETFARIKAQQAEQTKVERKH